MNYSPSTSLECKMHQSTTFRETVIAEGDVPNNPVRCPQCQGEDIVLYGYERFAYTAWLVNGEEVRTENCDTGEQTVEAIDCQRCAIRFRLMEKSEYELQSLSL